MRAVRARKVLIAAPARANMIQSRFLSSVSSLVYLIGLFLISSLPQNTAYSLAARLGRARYSRISKYLDPQKRAMETRLAVSSERADAVLRRSFEEAAREDLESWFYSDWAQKNVSEFIDLHGLEHLDAALDKGKGAILFSGHTRRLNTFVLALGLLGYRPMIIMDPARKYLNPMQGWLQKRRNELFVKLGCQGTYLHSGDASVGIRAAHKLKRNGVVLIFMDRPHEGKSFEVEFLNERVSIHAGPALLAKATECAMLDFWVCRPTEGGLTKAEIGEPFFVSDDAAAATQECAARLEQKIRENPHSWNPWLFPTWHQENAAHETKTMSAAMGEVATQNKR